MSRYQYGGQALVEGVLMRGRNALAVALRHPDGTIVWATERLDLGLRARRALKMPFVRGLVLLYDTLVTGTRWLVRSATLQALDEGTEAGPGSGGAGSSGGRPRNESSTLFPGRQVCDWRARPNSRSQRGQVQRATAPQRPATRWARKLVRMRAVAPQTVSPISS